jgi:hypothetical protein
MDLRIAYTERPRMLALILTFAHVWLYFATRRERFSGK